MTTETIQERFTRIQKGIEDTLNLIEELIRQSSEMTKLIATLEVAKKATPEQIDSLKKINEGITSKVYDLMSSLSELFDEYNETLRSL